MSINRKRKALAGALASLSLLAIVVAALVAGSGAAAAPDPNAGAPQADSASASGAPAISIGSVGAGASRFDILQPASSSSVQSLPESVTEVLANQPPSVSATSGFAESASSTPVPTGNTVTALGEVVLGGSEIVVAEASAGVCTLATGAEHEGAALGTCSSLEEAESGGSYVALPGMAPDAVRVIGLAPNGTSRIAVDSGEDGTTDETVPVSSNIYQVDLKPVPTVISGITESGQVAYQVKLPLDSYYEGATAASK